MHTYAVHTFYFSTFKNSNVKSVKDDIRTYNLETKLQGLAIDSNLFCLLTIPYTYVCSCIHGHHPIWDPAMLVELQCDICTQWNGDRLWDTSLVIISKVCSLFLWSHGIYCNWEPMLLLRSSPRFDGSLQFATLAMRIGVETTYLIIILSWTHDSLL